MGGVVGVGEGEVLEVSGSVELPKSNKKKERKYNMLSWPQNVGNPQFSNFSVRGCPGNPLHGTAFGAAQS